MSFHLFNINEVYSNADGTVQFIEFVSNDNFQDRWGGHSIISTNGASTNTFNVPTDLPSSATAGKSVLVATQGFANLGITVPDFIIPSGFLFINSGTVNFPGMDSFSYSVLPTDSTLSLKRNGTTAINSPMDFAGITGTVSGASGGPIDGAAGNDTLNGTAGDDKMSGLAGNDILKGLAGNDTMDGGIGDDRMTGGAGDDTYHVDAKKDTVTEKDNEGFDTIISSISYILSKEVEALELSSGMGNLFGTGNKGNNVLTGNDGNNTLNGKEGKDTLEGGTGKDKFVFDAKLGAVNVDIINDFISGEDVIYLSKKIFAKAVTDKMETDKGDGLTLDGGELSDTQGAAHFIYDSANGTISYDADSSGPKLAVQFATLAGAPDLVASDLHIF